MYSSLNLKKFIAILAVSFVLFANIVIANARYIILVCLILGVSLIYGFCLVLERPKLTNKILSSAPVVWVILFAVEMFLYGYFGSHNEAYSFKFHVLNIVSIFLFIIILLNNSSNAIDIVVKSSSIIILAMSFFILRNGSFSLFGILSGNEIERVGTTAVGNENTTAISYIFLMIPIMYKIGVEKSKRYIPIAIIGAIFMLLTGSKKVIISIIISFITINFGLSTNKTKFINNILKIVVFMFLTFVFCYSIPVLHELIWVRFESMINSMTGFDFTDQSSTGLRINYIITAFTKAWDKPIFGHGWASFAPMYGYSSLYKMNLYTHNNYAEILFSFGLTGIFLYYWFPIKMIKITKRLFNTQKKILSWMYILNALFIDFTTVSCYSSILGFLSFIIVYLVLQDSIKIK